MDQGTLFDLPAPKPRRADSLAAEARFRKRLKELGATLLEPRWLGAQTKHRVRCRGKHDCLVIPAAIRPGGSFCYKCAGRDPVATEAAFLARLAELGCTPLYEKYLGRNKPHHCLCRAGHDCYPRPGQLRLGKGPCRRCTGLDSSVAKAAFYARMAEIGAVVLGEYRNANTKVHAICAAGHDCYALPSGLQHGRGICITCAGRDPAVAEAKFLSRLRELGATPAYEKWGGVECPLHVICAGGHDCYPRPHQVNSGDGICATCAGWNHTVFYVLEHATEPVVKFGITSQSGKRRLTAHERDGYAKSHLLVTGLPQGTARDAENAVKAALALASEKPVRGCEYFPAPCLALILDVATAWLGAAAA
jgi:hypothetical protein